MPPPIDRIHILESVLVVWREDGYQRATTRKIAALAGITEMTLFRRFGDKGALFRAALELEAERFATDAISYTGSLSVDLERIVGAYEALLDRSVSIVLDFLVEAPRNPDLAAIRSVPMAAIGRIASIIGQYQRDGHLRGRSPIDIVLALLSPLLMAALLRRAQPGLAIAMDRRAYVRNFLEGWAAEE